MRAPLVLAVATLAAVTGPAGSADTNPPIVTRAFTVEASAFPVDPAPGTNQISLGIRPLATRASLANAPVEGYARAAAYDVGFIENYTGPPPPETTAECDATRPNLPRD